METFVLRPRRWICCDSVLLLLAVCTRQAPAIENLIPVPIYMIANSDNGEVREVTSEGNIVWRVWNPRYNQERRRATIVRIKHYDAEGIDPLLAAGGSARSPRGRWPPRQVPPRRGRTSSGPGG